MMIVLMIPLTETDKCQNGQVWRECTRCQKVCGKVTPDCSDDDDDDTETCDEGCACPSDLAWDGDEEQCVPVEECKCLHLGNKYSIGESYEQDCRIWYVYKK